jgi:hypothetical protein
VKIDLPIMILTGATVFTPFRSGNTDINPRFFILACASSYSVIKTFQSFTINITDSLLTNQRAR